MKRTTELAKAQEHHKHGRLREAETAYRKAMGQDPRSARARARAPRGYRVPQDDPLRPIKKMADEALKRL